MRKYDVQIRNARWLLELAAPEVASTPNCAEALETARQLLGQLAGDFREGEAEKFTELERKTEE